MQEPLRYPSAGALRGPSAHRQRRDGDGYLARAVGPRGFEREVALKLVHPHLRDDERLAADLIEEAKLSVRIRHPNVVPVLDAGEDAAGVYLAMDYVEGDSLSGLVRAAAAAGIELPASIASACCCMAGRRPAPRALGDAAGRSLSWCPRLLAATARGTGPSLLADFAWPGLERASPDQTAC